MEEDYQFNFTQMKRSDIIIEVIKTAGLKPEVDPTGLNDEVIDYTNISSDSSSDDESVDTSNLPAEACKFAKQLAKGKSSKTEKAKAVWNWINSNCPYNYYSNSRYSESNIYQAAKEHIGQKTFNCCDHAHLSAVLLKCLGFKVTYMHGHNHVWALLYLDGEKVHFDPLGTSSASWGTAWGGTSGTESESISF
jgi:transglutaminase-like putative cysteine protease